MIRTDETLPGFFVLGDPNLEQCYLRYKSWSDREFTGKVKVRAPMKLKTANEMAIVAQCHCPRPCLLLISLHIVWDCYQRIGDQLQNMPVLAWLYLASID